MKNDYTKVYNGFSGVDILVVPGEREIQAIEYSISREALDPNTLRKTKQITGRILLRNEDPEDATLEQLLKKPFSVKLRGRNEYDHLMVMFINDIEICAGNYAPWDFLPFTAQTVVPWHAGKIL